MYATEEAAALVVDAAGRVVAWVGGLRDAAATRQPCSWREALAAVTDVGGLPDRVPCGPQTYDLRAHDGAHLTMQVVPVAAAGGGGALLLLCRRPILAEADLRRERMSTLGSLAAGAAHEMNNVLTLIFGWLQLMVADETDPEKRKTLHLVADAADRLGFLTRHLLEFARAPLGKVAPVDVNQALDDVLALVGYQLEKNNIQVRRELDAGLPRIQGSRAELCHACLNLVLNAMHAMPQGGTLTVRTGAAEGRVVIEIADTGCGMPPEVRQRLFQPFFTTRAGGTGLGLLVCREIVARHGGEIAVRSEVGKGTVFTLRFPSRVEETANVVNA